MRQYIVELTGISKKKFSIIAKSAEEASKTADLIVRKTNLIQFDNNDVVCIELEIFPSEETSYEDNDVHISEIKVGNIRNRNNI